MLPAQSKESAFDSLDVARLQVMYDLTYREDTTRMGLAGNERMLLLIGNTVSDFESYKNYRLNRIRFERMYDGTYPEWFTENGGDFTGRYMFQVFKNSPNGKMTVTDHVFLTDKFVFEFRTPGSPTEGVIYQEPTLQGNATMAYRKSTDPETNLNLELLFNATVSGSFR